VLFQNRNYISIYSIEISRTAQAGVAISTPINALGDLVVGDFKAERFKDEKEGKVALR
jgi:hypothetical protein